MDVSVVALKAPQLVQVQEAGGKVVEEEEPLAELQMRIQFTCQDGRADLSVVECRQLAQQRLLCAHHLTQSYAR